MLVDAFKSTIFPYMIQLGAILFVISILSGSYSMMRKPNWQEFIEKLRNSVIAYACAKSAFVILAFIDKIVSGIKL